ncbi:hypothetical protein [Bradyrhizobium sp. C9]|uniref:hypothetical protein n=1 Tax=Bradyrhizobium sp. C9 TaxID=142585 RepID=UPI000BE9CA56|nr:hypothetical protein [Bradyrhizobium sp. C9]PDT75216.1 hypothetical protein CO675_20600 [Bradyrhizobium sp. C9]
MTRAITLAALTCLLLAGAAITAILGRDSLPAAQADIGPVANRAGKQDKLAVTTLATAAFEAPRPAEPPASPSPLLLRAQAAIPGATDTVRQAYASVEPADIGLPTITDPAVAAQPQIAEPAAPAQIAPAPPKPKVAAKPVQKTYALLSDAQIAGIKDRLKLSSSQEYYWPAVETALRAVARKIHAKRQGDPASGTMPIDPDSEEVQQLKSAAMPLLFQLREDQKNEVRSLARLIGLERVASMI